MARDNPKQRNAFKQMCAEDKLFYFNTFCVTFDPRKIDNPAIPFITYEYQDYVFAFLEEAYGREDVYGDKSRDMGLSWMYLFEFDHKFKFRELQSLKLVSEKEDLVDRKDDPDCLFWKLDFNNKNQPSWLLPEMNRKHLTMSNKDTGSTIVGCATTEDIGRGGRSTAMLIDEYAAIGQAGSVNKATRDNTNCRFFNTTPKGQAHDSYKKSKSNMRRLRVHWTVHPEKSKGLYYDGATTPITPWYVSGKGHPRSPWYDTQCERAATRFEIAQELDCDYAGSGSVWFDAHVISSHKNAYGREPLFKCDIEINEDLTIKRITKNPKGKWSFWQEPDMHNQWPTIHSSVIGADVAAGTGSSNSTASLGWAETGIKFAEYANAWIDPIQFCNLLIAVSKWIHGKQKGAYLIFEANGPTGSQFEKQIKKLTYPNVYLRNTNTDKGEKATPGYHTRKKSPIFRDYAEALKNGGFLNPSIPSLDETLEYIYGPQGEPVHGKALDKEQDSSGAKESHGDRVVADVMLNMGLNVKQKEEEEKPTEIPIGCAAWRMEQLRKAKQAKRNPFWTGDENNRRWRI